MHIKKPNEMHGYRVTDNYPHSFLEFTHREFDSNALIFENGYEELLNRFGNFECMCISYLLDGGYWIHDDSIVLREYLNHYYSHELETLATSIKYLNSFKNPSGISVNGRDLYWIYREQFRDPHLNYAHQLFQYPEIKEASLVNDNTNDSSLHTGLPEPVNTNYVNIDMQILGGFIAVLGVAAVATAFTILSGVTIAIAVGVGIASTLIGIGLFSIEPLTVAPRDLNQEVLADQECTF